MDTTQEPTAGSSSSQKGKGIEADTKNWRAGWWDVYPILERPKRPIVWSQTSVLFSADATQPIITGRHFSSSKQFVLPSPTPIMSSMASYEPPSLITVSPGDAFLLAYFPRRDGDGTACLWERGPQIDNWSVKECWSCTKGSGIVTASWLAAPREYIVNSAGPSRLPPRGPSVPVGDMSLLMVTQDNYVHVNYFWKHSHGLRTVRRSLQFQGFSKEQTISSDYGELPHHMRQCVDAAIGLGFNETTVFIATHSRRLPTAPAPPAPGKAFQNLGLPVGEDPMNHISPEQRTKEWGEWGDERAIEIFELHVRFDGTHLTLVATQIGLQDFQPRSLTSLTFVSTVPPRPSAPLPSDAATSSQPKPYVQERGRLGLVASFVDFHDHTKTPTSTLVFFGINTRPPANGRPSVSNVIQATSRTVEQGVITHVDTFTDLTGPMVYACIIDVSGVYNVAKSSPHQATVGTIRVLNLPNFSDNISWVPSDVKISVDRLGSDLPLYGTISPHKKLFCALTSTLSNDPMTIHPIPLPTATDTIKPRLAMACCSGILTKTSTSDIIHSICTSEYSLSDIGDILKQMLDILEIYNNSGSLYVTDIMGIATEVYRQKAESSKTDSETEVLKRRWQTALDICSLSAVIRAFDDCRDNRDGSKYDLDIVWQLIALSTWVIEFTERIMKACIMASNATLEPQEQSDIDLLTFPALLNISHPFALENLIAALTHVKALRTFLGSLPAGSENAKMAQTLLLDTVDCSGVDFEGLLPLLQQHLEAVQKLEPEDCRRALATCQPTNSMQPVIYQLVQQISKSETLLNKSALFIKPHHLIEGIARLSTAPQQKSSEKDVISKNSLPKEPVQRDVCLRCGGKTAIDRTLHQHRGHLHSKWHIFELTWQLRCICGGLWSSSMSI